MKGLKDERKVIYDAMDAASAGQAKLIEKVNELKKKIDPKYNTLETVPKGIKDAEKKYSTSSGGKNAETESIKRINFLK